MNTPPVLRIAQVAPVIFPVPPVDAGGTERIVADLGEALAALGHEVTLFAGADSSARLPRVGELPSLSSLESVHGPVAPGVPGALEAARLEDLRSRMGAFDIVHCHTDFTHAAVLGDARAHSLTTLHWRTDELDRQLLFQRFPDLPVATVSAAQARHVPASNHVVTVHHGLAEERFTNLARPGNTLVFLGRMTDQKRPDRAIDIARLAHRPLRLAGGRDVGNPEYFERVIADHLGGDITYIGPVGEQDKPALFDGAAAFLFPIDWPEPFGLVLIEAMAHGVPVIAWRRGAVEEIIEPGITGFIVESCNEAAAAVEACEALDRQVIRQRFLERFTARRMARDYVEVYRHLLATRQHRTA